MPESAAGQKVLRAMKAKLGAKEGARRYYSSINAGTPGSEQWHQESGSGRDWNRRSRMAQAIKKRLRRMS